MAKMSKVAQAALSGEHDSRVDLYYEDSWGAGYIAVVRYMGDKSIDYQTWNASMINPRWLFSIKSGWGLPFEEEYIDDEATIVKRMRDIQPDLRRWKKRYSWGGGAWWLY